MQHHADLTAAIRGLPNAIAAALVKLMGRKGPIPVKNESSAGRRAAQDNGGDSDDSKCIGVESSSPFKSGREQCMFVRYTRKWLCGPNFNKKSFYIKPVDFVKRLTESNKTQVFAFHPSNTHV